MNRPAFHVVVCYAGEPDDVYVSVDSFASARVWHRLASAVHPEARIEIRKLVHGRWSRLAVAA